MYVINYLGSQNQWVAEIGKRMKPDTEGREEEPLRLGTYCSTVSELWGFQFSTNCRAFLVASARPIGSSRVNDDANTLHTMMQTRYTQGCIDFPGYMYMFSSFDSRPTERLRQPQLVTADGGFRFAGSFLEANRVSLCLHGSAHFSVSECV